jgi:hypothetical protein
VLAARRAYVRGVKRAVMAGCVAWSNATRPSAAVLPCLRAEGVAPPEGVSEDDVLLLLEQRRLLARLSCDFPGSTDTAAAGADVAPAATSDCDRTAFPCHHHAAVGGSCDVPAPAAPAAALPVPLLHQHADRLLAEAYCLYAEGMHRGAWSKYLFAAHCLLTSQPQVSQRSQLDGSPPVRVLRARKHSACSTTESAAPVARPAAEHVAAEPAAAERVAGGNDSSHWDLASSVLHDISLSAASRVASVHNAPTLFPDAGAAEPPPPIAPAAGTAETIAEEECGILLIGVETLLNAAACASRLPNVGNLRVACVPPAGLPAAVGDGVAGAGCAAETAPSLGAIAAGAIGFPRPTSLLLPPPQALALAALQLLHLVYVPRAGVTGVPVAIVRWLALRACHWLALAPADTLQRPLLPPAILDALSCPAADVSRPAGVVSPAAAAVLPWLRWAAAELRPEAPAQPSAAGGADKAAATRSRASEAAQRQQRATLQRELAAICVASLPLQFAPAALAATNDARHPTADSSAALADTNGGSVVPAHDAPGLTNRLWHAIF